jgi:hypothetical protein
LRDRLSLLELDALHGKKIPRKRLNDKLARNNAGLPSAVGMFTKGVYGRWRSDAPIDSSTPAPTK